MRTSFLFIFICAIMLTGCSARKDNLLACQEKENHISKLILDETKEIMDSKHPEFKDINNTCYMKMICHDQLILARLNYALINHPRKITMDLGVPSYDLNENELSNMKNDPKINKLLQEKATLEQSYDICDNKEEYWKYRKIEGKEVFKKYQPQIDSIIKDWEIIKKSYKP